LSTTPIDVAPAFWTDPALRALRMHTKMIALYLLTCPASRTEGTYDLRVADLVGGTGCSLLQCAVALDELSNIGFAFYNVEAEIVCVPEMGRYRAPAPSAPLLH
jgi:hypothetical protein